MAAALKPLHCTCRVVDFAPQGFTRGIMLPRDRWVGFIKNYNAAPSLRPLLCIRHVMSCS
jgi:hypothetical protein